MRLSTFVDTVMAISFIILIIVGVGVLLTYMIANAL